MSTAEISSQISINTVTVNATFIARQHIIAIRKATLIIAISSVCRSLRLSRASIASEVLRNQSSNQCYTPLRGSFSNAKDLEQITLGHPNGAPNWHEVGKIGDYRPISRYISDTIQDRNVVISDPVSPGTDDHLRSGKISQYIIKLPRPTQPPTFNGTGNEYQSKCGDTLRLGSKGRYGSFYLSINVWMADKTVWSLVNTCHTLVP